MALNFSFYRCENEKEWDNFVANKSMNGTFLQTRRFINYHPKERFKDCSICIRKGNELVAVILACEVEDEGKKTFFAHKGSTFGGITIASNIYTASIVNELMEGLQSFLIENGFQKIYLKMVPDIYQTKGTDLLDYFLYKNGFQCYNELNYYMVMENYKEEITAPFTSGKRRDYRYSLKNELIFKKLETRDEIAAYYQVILMNLKKFQLTAVHSLDDLFDLKFNRFDHRIEFYGVFKNNDIIAGSMLFYFGDDIVHTQYLSSNENYLKLFPMDFLICNLIKTAVEKGMRIFTFGICTEDQGHYLNLGLSRFKEGFGTEFCINRSYEKVL